MLKFMKKKVEMKNVVMSYTFNSKLDKEKVESIVFKYKNVFHAETHNGGKTWVWMAVVRYKDYVKICKEMNKKRLHYNFTTRICSDLSTVSIH